MMRGITIRRAEPADAPGVVALIERVYHEYDFIFVATDETPDLLAFDSAYGNHANAFFVATAGDAVVGSIGAKRQSPSTAELVRLYVAREARGGGLGRLLVEQVITWARATRAHRLELWSDTRFLDAHRLYQRLGFTRGGTRRIEDANATEEHQFWLVLEETGGRNSPSS